MAKVGKRTKAAAEGLDRNKFYDLDEAVKMVMGHVDDSMLSEHYTDRFPEERLLQVASHVREWLFPPRATR